MVDTCERNYIRHPSDIPIEIHISQLKPANTMNMVNISQGGLAYISTNFIAPGTLITIRIPSISQEFQVEGLVTWCRRNKAQFDVGIQFKEKDQLYNTRMIEQICHIEHYRKQIRDTENRELSSEQAALEWIDKYAATFPAPNLDNSH